MLQIIINKEYTLQLPDNFEMRIVDENPLFINDRIPVPHTIGFEVETTPDNLAFFGYPNRFTTANITNKYTMEVYHFGSLVMEGELIILTADSKILKLQFINAFLPESAKKKMNQIDWGHYDYGQIDPDAESLDYSDAKYNDYKQAVYDSVHNPDTFVTAPVRLKGVDWEGSNANWGMLNAVRLYLNYYNVNNQNWTFPNTPPEDSGHKYFSQAIFPVLPFPYIHHLISTFFGIENQDNPFYVDENLRRLVSVCFNHKYKSPDNFYTVVSLSNRISRVVLFPLVDDYAVVGGTHIKNYTEQKSFMQAYPFNEFLKNILTLFGLTCFIEKNISFEYNNDLIDSTDIVNLSAYVIGMPEMDYQKAQIYNLNYGEELTDELSETVSPIPTGVLDSLIFGHLGETQELTKSFRVTGTPNLVYEFLKKPVGISENINFQKFIIQSSIKVSALSTPKIEDDEKEVLDIGIAVKPLEVNVEPVWYSHRDFETEYITGEHWVVPVIDNTDLTAPPYIMIDRGLGYTSPFKTNQYRSLLNHHTDPQGFKFCNLSLLINQTDPDGVFLKYHKKIADWHNKDRLKAKINLLLTPLHNKAISNKQKIHLFGRNFFIVKREYSISDKYKIPVTFYLIET